MRRGDRLADQRLGGVVLAVSALLVLGVQIAQPVHVPLYDGVVIQEPYRFLHPTGDEAGSPTSYSGQKPVAGELSPIFAAATSENPPQAQLIAQRGAFTLSSGAQQLNVTITPVEPPAPPEGASISGNVYRFSVTDQAGTPLSVRECSGCLSLLLRARADTEAASIKRFADGAWHDVETVHAGMVDLYQTNATAMGDYAVIAENIDAPGDGTILGLDSFVAIGGGAVIVLLLIGIVVLLRIRPAAPEPEPAPRTRIPSKRKAPRR